MSARGGESRSKPERAHEQARRPWGDTSVRMRGGFRPSVLSRRTHWWFSPTWNAVFADGQSDDFCPSGMPSLRICRTSSRLHPACCAHRWLLPVWNGSILQTDGFCPSGGSKSASDGRFSPLWRIAAVQTGISAPSMKEAASDGRFASGNAAREDTRRRKRTAHPAASRTQGPTAYSPMYSLRPSRLKCRMILVPLPSSLSTSMCVPGPK